MRPCAVGGATLYRTESAASHPRSKQSWWIELFFVDGSLLTSNFKELRLLNQELCRWDREVDFRVPRQKDQNNEWEAEQTQSEEIFTATTVSNGIATFCFESKTSERFCATN